MIEKDSHKYKISEFLYDLNEEHIATLDQEATNGEAWHLYCDSYISRPTVFQNKISGRFKNFSEDQLVEVVIDEKQIITFCSTCRIGEICVHAVALLYSWVYDSEAFANVAESLRQLEDMNKVELIEIIARMLLKDSNNIELMRKKSVEDDGYDIDGLWN
jgi:hypothetical protein